jgi:hypothetical protein
VIAAPRPNAFIVIGFPQLRHSAFFDHARQQAKEQHKELRLGSDKKGLPQVSHCLGELTTNLVHDEDADIIAVIAALASFT